ncbi:MAG: hypothetical protein ABIH50_06705 [bacterium]
MAAADSIGIVRSSSANSASIAIPYSDKPTYDRIYDLVKELRGGKEYDKRAFNAKLDKIFANGGKMSKAQFTELLELNTTGPVRTAFWLLFTGTKDDSNLPSGMTSVARYVGEEVFSQPFYTLFGNSFGAHMATTMDRGILGPIGQTQATIDSPEEFEKALLDCQETIGVTGDTLQSLSHNPNIIPVKKQDIRIVLKDMKLTKTDIGKSKLLEANFKRALAARGKTPGDMNDDLTDMTDKDWERMGYGLFIRYSSSAIWRELGIHDIERLDLSDPLMRERFGVGFKAYVTEDKLPTKKEITGLLEFQDRVAIFRKWADKNIPPNDLNAALGKFDINRYDNDEFNKKHGRTFAGIMDDCKTLGKQGILDILKDRKYRKLNGSPS